MAIIVGDIHGNIEKVRAFLTYKPETKHVALGDYLDSFTEPPARQLEALQLLLQRNSVLLWGNHDVHYLKTPPWICTGFQYGREAQYQSVIESHKNRFVAAQVVDGWLCTHAGVDVHLAKGESVENVAAKFNTMMTEYLNCPYVPGPQGIFAIGRGRGGESRSGGIFWFDFKREISLDTSIRQIFGHTETKEPVVTETFVALDTTNTTNVCWVFDTATNEVVPLPMTG